MSMMLYVGAYVLMFYYVYQCLCWTIMVCCAYVGPYVLMFCSVILIDAYDLSYCVDAYSVLMLDRYDMLCYCLYASRL
jgi:hypothetical protein